MLPQPPNQLQLSCYCGVTLSLSAQYQSDLRLVLKEWQLQHQKCQEAALVVKSRIMEQPITAELWDASTLLSQEQELSKTEDTETESIEAETPASQHQHMTSLLEQDHTHVAQCYQCQVLLAGYLWSFKMRVLGVGGIISTSLKKALQECAADLVSARSESL